VIAILLIIVIAYEPEYTLLGLSLLYVISGPVLTFVLLRRRRTAKPFVPEEKTA
jgi:DMSO reductase anchor subunit